MNKVFHKIIIFILVFAVAAGCFSCVFADEENTEPSGENDSPSVDSPETENNQNPSDGGKENENTSTPDNTSDEDEGSSGEQTEEKEDKNDSSEKKTEKTDDKSDSSENSIEKTDDETGKTDKKDSESGDDSEKSDGDESPEECDEHDFSEWEITDFPCIKDGRKERVCLVCGYKEELVIPVCGHNVEEFIEKYAPSCTSPGIEEGVCSVCGLTVMRVVAMIDHEYSQWTVLSESTCSTAGAEERSCLVCGYKETKVSDLLPHTYEGYTILREASLCTTGKVQAVCEVCKEVITEETPCSYTDDKTGIKITSDKSVFPDGTVINAEKLDETAISENVKNTLSALSKNYVIYSVKASRNGNSVDPSGDLQLSFILPSGYANNTVVIRVNDDGSYALLGTQTYYMKLSVTADTDKLGKFAICTIENRKNSFIWLIVAAAELLLLGFVLYTLVFYYKKTQPERFQIIGDDSNKLLVKISDVFQNLLGKDD